MFDLDAHEIGGLAIVTVFVGGSIMLLLATVWQSFHCVMCGRWLPWRSVKDMNYACENKGQCRLAALVRQIRSGNI